MSIRLPPGWLAVIPCRRDVTGMQRSGGGGEGEGSGNHCGAVRCGAVESCLMEEMDERLCSLRAACQVGGIDCLGACLLQRTADGRRLPNTPLPWEPCGNELPPNQRTLPRLS